MWQLGKLDNGQLCIKDANGGLVATFEAGSDAKRLQHAATFHRMQNALERIERYAYRADRRHRQMVDIGELEDVIRIARVVLNDQKAG